MSAIQKKRITEQHNKFPEANVGRLQDLYSKLPQNISTNFLYHAISYDRDLSLRAIYCKLSKKTVGLTERFSLAGRGSKRGIKNLNRAPR